jgi:hypothetical protein
MHYNDVWVRPSPNSLFSRFEQIVKIVCLTPNGNRTRVRREGLLETKTGSGKNGVIYKGGWRLVSLSTFVISWVTRALKSHSFL